MKGISFVNGRYTPKRVPFLMKMLYKRVGVRHRGEPPRKNVLTLCVPPTPSRKWKINVTLINVSYLSVDKNFLYLLLRMETWSLDSLLVSFISDHRWKWIYNLPRLQQTRSTHQNQRVYCFTRRGDFFVGLSVIPSGFFCDITNTCYLPQVWFSWVNFIKKGDLSWLKKCTFNLF